MAELKEQYEVGWVERLDALEEAWSLNWGLLRNEKWVEVCALVAASMGLELEVLESTTWILWFPVKGASQSYCMRGTVSHSLKHALMAAECMRKSLLVAVDELERQENEESSLVVQRNIKV